MLRRREGHFEEAHDCTDLKWSRRQLTTAGTYLAQGTDPWNSLAGDGFLYAMSSAQFCTGGSLRVVLCFSNTSLLFYSLHGQPSLFRPSLSWPLGMSIIEWSTLRQDLASRVLAKCWSVFAGEHYFLCKNSPPSISQGKGIDNYFFVKSNFKKWWESFCLHPYPQADFYWRLLTIVVKETGLFYFAKVSIWSVFHEYTHTHKPSQPCFPACYM